MSGSCSSDFSHVCFEFIAILISRVVSILRMTQLQYPKKCERHWEFWASPCQDALTVNKFIGTKAAHAYLQRSAAKM